MELVQKETWEQKITKYLRAIFENQINYVRMLFFLIIGVISKQEWKSLELGNPVNWSRAGYLVAFILAFILMLFVEHLEEIFRNQRVHTKERQQVLMDTHSKLFTFLTTVVAPQLTNIDDQIRFFGEFPNFLNLISSKKMTEELATGINSLMDGYYAILQQVTEIKNEVLDKLPGVNIKKKPLSSDELNQIIKESVGEIDLNSDQSIDTE